MVCVYFNNHQPPIITAWSPFQSTYCVKLTKCRCCEYKKESGNCEKFIPKLIWKRKRMSTWEDVEYLRFKNRLKHRIHKKAITVKPDQQLNDVENKLHLSLFAYLTLTPTDRPTHPQTPTPTNQQRHRQPINRSTQTQTPTQTDQHRHPHRQTNIDTDTHTQTNTYTHRLTNTYTDTHQQTNTSTDTHTDRPTHPKTPTNRPSHPQTPTDRSTHP